VIRIVRLAALATVFSALATAGFAQGQNNNAGMVANPCPTDQDFASLCRYAAEDAGIAQNPRVILFGDSITERWVAATPDLFTLGIVSRGIAGQTTTQMLLRFYQDVVALEPQAVQIMGGTNDIAGNSGPTSPQDFKNDIMAMVELAQAHRIRVLLASIPPTDTFSWNPAVKPASRILELNAWLRTYAFQKKIVFVDYYTVLASKTGGLRPELGEDGTHPNANGYARMRPVLLNALTQVLGPHF
jgi:lysophospholipase L1-like esterase